MDRNKPLLALKLSFRCVVVLWLQEMDLTPPWSAGLCVLKLKPLTKSHSHMVSWSGKLSPGLNSLETMETYNIYCT